MKTLEKVLLWTVGGLFALMLCWTMLPKPDVDALYASNPTTSKALFALGVYKVVLAMNCRLPQTYKTFGSVAPIETKPTDDTKFGVPSVNVGCDGLTMDVAFGEDAAMCWYAERGMFPANSTLPRTSHEVQTVN